MRVKLLIICLLSLLCCISIHAQLNLKINSGVSAGGTGIAGIPFQVASRFAAIDAAVYLRTIHVNEFEERWFLGPSADMGINFILFDRLNAEDNLRVRHGIYIKTGFGIHKKQEDDLIRVHERSKGAGWFMEVDNLKHPGRFFQFQMGPSIVEREENFFNSRYPSGHQIQCCMKNISITYFRATLFFKVIR